MAAIKEATTISQEVRQGEVFGAVKLYNLDDSTKPESSAGRMLGMRVHSLMECLVPVMKVKEDE